MRVTVYGLWHLGCVTAACLAEAGHDVVGLDPEPSVVDALKEGRPLLHEPGLAELTRAGLAAGRLAFTTSPADALRNAEVLWVALDTPVDEDDQADVGKVRQWLEAVASDVRPGTLVLISSQVPVGFTSALASDWSGRGLPFAYSPENLRLGRALDSFRQPERVIVGIQDQGDRGLLTALFEPFCPRIEWMSIESAEMTKHALNAFLATSVAFMNELARLCEALGADAKDVERGLKSEGRIGPRAYLAPGAAFAGGTLARDVRFLASLGDRHGLETPLLDGLVRSNDLQKDWIRDKLRPLLEAVPSPKVAVLGLAYKPGTNVVRRSASVELCAWLIGQGAEVDAHDPEVVELPESLRVGVRLCGSSREALAGADVVVIATEWPEYRALRADDFVELMRRPHVLDPGWFLAEHLAGDWRIGYVAAGRPEP